MNLPPLSLLGEPEEGGSDQYPKDTWTTSIPPGVCAPQEKKKSGDGSSEAKPPLRTHSLTFKEGLGFDFAQERYRVRGFPRRFQHYHHEKGLPAQMLNVF